MFREQNIYNVPSVDLDETAMRRQALQRGKCVGEVKPPGRRIEQFERVLGGNMLSLEQPARNQSIGEHVVHGMIGLIAVLNPPIDPQTI